MEAYGSFLILGRATNELWSLLQGSHNSTRMLGVRAATYLRGLHNASQVKPILTQMFVEEFNLHIREITAISIGEFVEYPMDTFFLKKFLDVYDQSDSLRATVSRVVKGENIGVAEVMKRDRDYLVQRYWKEDVFKVIQEVKNSKNSSDAHDSTQSLYISLRLQSMHRSFGDESDLPIVLVEDERDFLGELDALSQDNDLAEYRYDIVQLLKYFTDHPQVPDILGRMCRDKNDSVRHKALIIFLNVEERSEYIPHFLELLRTDSSKDVRLSVLNLLSGCRGRQDVREGVVDALLTDMSGDVAKKAFEFAE